MITIRQAMETLSFLSRAHASCSGVRPSMACCGGMSVPRPPFCSATSSAAMSVIVRPLSAAGRGGRQVRPDERAGAGLVDARSALRDVLALRDGEVARHPVRGRVLEDRLERWHLLDADLLGLRAARVERAAA